MNAQAFPDRTPLPETSPPEKTIRQKRPLSLADPAVWRTTGRKAVNGSPSFLIHLFQTVSGHSWHFYPMPASQPESGYRHNGCYVSKHTIRTRPLGISCRKTSPAVFPVFFRLPYTGLPDPERQKNHCESAGQANFSPIPQKPCFDSPENVCRQILRVTAPFLFRRPPFSAVFPLKTRRFRRTTNRFLLSETPVWTVLAGKANAFSMSIGPPFKSRRPALRNFP